MEPQQVVERPHPLTGLARSSIALLAVLVFLGRELLGGDLGAVLQLRRGLVIVASLALGVVLFNLVLGALEWRTTTFVADADEFRIDRTLLRRESSRIAYPRIQSVEIERPLAARLLGLSSVQIDVGGVGTSRLQFLPHGRAEALRDELLRRMESLAPADAGPVAPETSEHEVLRVSPATLFRGALISNFLPWLCGTLALAALLWWLDAGLSAAAVLGTVLGLGGWVWREVAGNWDFRLSTVPDGVHIRRGLFTTLSQSVRADRIQAVAISQDFLQRLTGLYRVRATILGSRQDGEDMASGVLLPYGNRAEVRRVLGTFWPGIDLDRIQMHGQPARARWLTPLNFRQHRFGVDEHTAVVEHGWLDHTTSVLPHRRMQSIGVRQGPLQRLLGLAAVDLHVVDGPVQLRAHHLGTTQAHAFAVAQQERARQARLSPATYLATLSPPAPTTGNQSLVG